MELGRFYDVDRWVWNKIACFEGGLSSGITPQVYRFNESRQTSRLTLANINLDP